MAAPGVQPERGLRARHEGLRPTQLVTALGGRQLRRPGPLRFISGQQDYRSGSGGPQRHGGTGRRRLLPTGAYVYGYPRGAWAGLCPHRGGE
jgi:hypothetical protein